MPAMSTSEATIRSLVEAQVAAWNAGDGEAWARDFIDDAGFVNILGMRFEGRHANAQRHAELFAGIFRGSRLEVRELKLRVFGDAAIADALLDLSNFRGLPPGIRPSIGDELLRTRMHYALVFAADRWRIVFSQNTAVMPLPRRG